MLLWGERKESPSLLNSVLRKGRFVSESSISELIDRYLKVGQFSHRARLRFVEPN